MSEIEHTELLPSGEQHETAVGTSVIDAAQTELQDIAVEAAEYNSVVLLEDPVDQAEPTSRPGESGDDDIRMLSFPRGWPMNIRS